MTGQIENFAGGEVYFWIEQETIHIKAVSGKSDPVELTEDEAVKLATALLESVKKIKSVDSK